MTDLQKEFEATGFTTCIYANLYPDGKIYTQEYTQWLERQVLALRQPLVSGRSEQFYCASDKDNRYERCEEQCHLCKMEY